MGAFARASRRLKGALLALSSLTPVANKIVRYTSGSAGEMIDWLEAQTYTPVLSYSTPGDATFPGTVAGTYSKRGRHVSVTITLTAVTPTFTTAAGTFQVSLPFTAAASGPASLTQIIGLTLSSGYTAFGARASGAYANILQQGSGKTSVVFGATTVPSGTAITLTITLEYEATA